MVVAAQMDDYLLRLLVTKDLFRFATYVDMDSGSFYIRAARPESGAATRYGQWIRCHPTPPKLGGSTF